MSIYMPLRLCLFGSLSIVLGSCINVALIDSHPMEAPPKPPVAIAPPIPPVSRVLCDPPIDLILDPPPSASAEIIEMLKKDTDRGISMLGDYIRQLKLIIKSNNEHTKAVLDRVRESCKKYP